MKVLIVCSKNSGRIAAFIEEQVVSLQNTGVETDYFTVEGKGIKGYLSNRKALQRKIEEFNPDLIHAHYGLSGLLANLQRNVPVITTYHGSDINNRKVFPFSKLNMLLSAYSIFVSEKTRQKANLKRNYALIPCGVDVELFNITDKQSARVQLNLDVTMKYVLFAGSFTNQVKNPVLAIEASKMLPEATLLELTGYTREQVVLLMNAVDTVLMTSFTEGSPQFIKEAMACNCPVVSVPVGDVPEVLAGVSGCFLTSYETTDVAEKLKLALAYGKRTEGRKRILELGLDSVTVAFRIKELYEKVGS